MSHSKKTKRGYSLYLEQWNPNAKKYINVCKVCGRKFCSDPKNRAVYSELVRTLQRLPLDEAGRCEVCAGLMDGK